MSENILEQSEQTKGHCHRSVGRSGHDHRIASEINNCAAGNRQRQRVAGLRGVASEVHARNRPRFAGAGHDGSRCECCCRRTRVREAVRVWLVDRFDEVRSPLQRTNTDQ